MLTSCTMRLRKGYVDKFVKLLSIPDSVRKTNELCEDPQLDAGEKAEKFLEEWKTYLKNPLALLGIEGMQQGIHNMSEPVRDYYHRWDEDGIRE